MLNYILRRLLLIIPTLFGIMAVNFVIVQAAPGGPVEQMISHLKHGGTEMGPTERISGAGADLGARQNSLTTENATTAYRGAQGIDPAFIKEIEKCTGSTSLPMSGFS